ncbi:MAG: hypothetical protein Q9167_007550, partial [Letrouitia subvulpina]
MAGAGITTLVWDLGYVHAIKDFSVRATSRLVDRKYLEDADVEKGEWADDSSLNIHNKPLPRLPPLSAKPDSFRDSETTTKSRIPPPLSRYAVLSSSSQTRRRAPKRQLQTSASAFPKMSWQVGLLILTVFIITFILVTTLHAILPSPTRLSSLFSALYLAGTIIFGGGPVVIPLLREYIVAPGWVSSRDFLLGLAVIQAFPGPNFNFAIYLGSLAVARTRFPSFAGAVIAFVGMYAPGLFVVVGFMGLWRILKEKKWFLAVLRGVNAAAVGLVFAAVYKLWQIGCLTASVQGGTPL